MKTLQQNKLFRLALLAGVCTASCFADGDPVAVIGSIASKFSLAAASLCAITLMISLFKLGFTGIRAIGGAVAAGLVCWGVLNVTSVVSWFQGL